MTATSATTRSAPHTDEPLDVVISGVSGGSRNRLRHICDARVIEQIADRLRKTLGRAFSLVRHRHAQIILAEHFKCAAVRGLEMQRVLSAPFERDINTGELAV